MENDHSMDCCLDLCKFEFHRFLSIMKLSLNLFMLLKIKPLFSFFLLSNVRNADVFPPDPLKTQRKLAFRKKK